MSISKPYAYFQRIAKKLGIKGTIHSFRHTHASMLFEAGWSIKDVQELKNARFLEIARTGIFLLWRWRESNPRPRKHPNEFLRAQFISVVSRMTGEINKRWHSVAS